MGCGCNNITNINSDYIFQQIYKVEGNCDNKTKKKVFPVTTLQSVFDLCSGKYLQEIINSNNHLFVHFQGSKEGTYDSIPKSNRRKGLFITYIDNIGEVKTCHYIGTSLEDDDWNNPLNWKPIEEGTGSTCDYSDVIRRLELLEQNIPSCTTYLSELERRLAVLEAKKDANKYVVRGEHLKVESVIRLYYNDTPQTHFDIPVKMLEEHTQKYKILTGYKVDSTGSAQRPTEVDLTNTIETAVLPEEIRIDLQQDEYGYYIFAVDKALLPENYKVQLEAMGMFMDVTEDEMEEREVNINGRDYVMFIDNSGNMSFTPIRFKIVQL